MAVIRTIINKFAKKCKNCGVMVEVGAGYACNDENGWSTYCTTCCPSKKEDTRAEITDEGKVYFPYSPDNVALIKSLAYSSWNNVEKCWKVSLAPEHIHRVVSVCSSLNLKISDKVMEIFNNTKDKVVEDVNKKIEGKNLYPFQVDGVSFLSSKKKCLLGDEMGLGKTVQTLCSLPEKASVLIICPASLKYNWMDECKKWRPDLCCYVVNKKTDFKPPSYNEVVIINYDIVPSIPNNTGEFILICDEVHLCKNYKTKRSKAVKAWASVASKIIGLTGTPLMNKPFDLYGVFGALEMDREVFGSWGNFLRVFNGEKSAWGGYEFGNPSPIVPELLKRVMLRRRREEALPDLPKKSTTVIKVDNIPKDLKDQMDEMYDEWSVFLDAEDSLPPFEQFSLIRAKLAEARIPHLIEMVETHEEEGVPLVVFSAHKAPILELGKRSGWAVITGSTSIKDRRDAVAMFQAGLLKGIALTIQAGGVGLTLTHAWKAIFVDLDWTPALNSQAADRICRIGQTKPCEIVHLVSEHPLDLHIMKLIMKKMDLFDKAIDSSIKANPASNGSSGETEEEYEARMKKASEIAIKEEERQVVQVDLKSLAKNRVLQILEHERKRNGNKIVEPVITPQIMEEVKIGFDKMLSVCDGAHMKDGQGFNKPDASLSRYLYQAGFDDKEVALAGYYMLRRYPRQISDFLKTA